jgi:hypothetical protein
MSRLYCDHLVPVEEDCEKCIDIKMQEFHDTYWATARAWQALRDWLNGTPEQWQAECDQAYREGCDRGVEYERHETHYLCVQLKELNDRHMALIKHVAEGQSMLPPRVLIVSGPNKVTP